MTAKFDAKACAVLANLGLSRIRLHKNKRTEQGKALNREVLQLLLVEKEDQARIRVVNAIHNDYYLDTLNTLEVFLNVIAASTDVLAAQLSVPLEMKEAVCSICYAAPFLDNSPEMMKIRTMLLAKYKKDEDLLKTTLVNKKVLLGLSHDMPDDALINYYLSNILNEHSPSETAPVAQKAPSPAPEPKPAPAPTVTSPPLTQPLKPKEEGTLDIIISQVKLGATQLIGIMRIDANGHHWVLQNEASPPTFIPGQHTLNSKDGDTVIVTLDERKDGKRSGKVFRNLTVEASSATVLATSAAKSHSPLSASKSLGMSTLAAEHHIGEASGTLIVDLQQHAWVMDPKYAHPIYVPPIGLGHATAGDFVVVQVLKKGQKLLGRVTSCTHTPKPTSPKKPSPSHIAPKPPIKDEIEFELKENAMLSNLSWKRIPLQQRRGLFKHEDDHFGMVIDEEQPLETPVVVVGDAHRNGAEHGDRVQVVAFGQTTNPTTNSTIILGQITSILESQPKAPIQAQEAPPKSNPLPSAIPAISSDRPPPRNVKLVSPTAGDFASTLELDENGDGCMEHPTLPWTYVIIPKSELGEYCVGDEVAIKILDEKPHNGKMQGKLLGIVSAVDSYDMHAQFEYEHDESELGTGQESTIGEMDGVSAIEASLETLNAFEPEHSNTAIDRSLPYPVLDVVNPQEVIVLDVGSLSIKVGYANQPVPILSVPTLSGRLLDSLAPQRSALAYSSASTTSAPSDLVVGKAAYDRRALLQLSHPFRRGLVSDWTVMKNLLLGAITSLNMDLKRATVVLLESEAANVTEDRKHFAEILFKDFNLPFLFFARSSTGVLISERRTSGIIVDIGHTTTCITAVADGKILDHLTVRFPLAGLDITNHLIALLEDDGYRMFQTEAQRISAEDMKIATAFVRTEFHPSSASPNSLGHTGRKPHIPYTKPVTYRLHDGTELIIADQSWMCTEILFKPTIIGQDVGGLHEHLAKVIQNSPNAEVADNIFLVGGTSLLPGLRQRLQNELQRLLPHQQVFVDHPSKAQYSAWIGGALVSRLPDFKDCTLSKEEYLAEGPTVIEMTFE